MILVPWVRSKPKIKNRITVEPTLCELVLVLREREFELRRYGAANHKETCETGTWMDSYG